MKVAPIYNQEGQKNGEIKLNEVVWNVQPNLTLIQALVQAHRSNARAGSAHTKTRGEVRGGGRKPWKQKGTGRARHGSIRSPLWRGGGITFGPRNTKKYTINLTKKAKQKALCMVLSNKLAEDRLVIIESLAFPQPKTKFAMQWLHKLPVKNRSVLIALPDRTEHVRALRNLPQTGITPISSMNVYELLRHEYLVIPKEGIDMLDTKYSKI